MSLMVCVLTLTMVPCSCTSAGQGTQLRATTLRPEDDDSSSSSLSVIEPMSFEQTLIVCNAYPSHSEMIASKNGERLVNMSTMPFRECRHLNTQLRAHDKLDLTLVGPEIRGTFEVRGLPSSDSVLLLVVQKRENSQLINFQSFAFPLHSDTEDAQLAVIDAYPQSDEVERLVRMEDVFDGNKGPERKRRLEELSFNRVYAVEQGTYVARDRAARKLMKLWDGTDYILLRTGDGSDDFPESLVLYPDISDLHEFHAVRSGAASMSWPLFVCLNILLLMLSMGPYG